jgi:hypothetical protein
MATMELWDLNHDPKWRKEHPDKVTEQAQTMAEIEANAALIENAPDMLEAMKGLLEDYQDEHGAKVCDCRPEPENQGHICNACKARIILKKLKI